jgi:hypothetical protein
LAVTVSCCDRWDVLPFAVALNEILKLYCAEDPGSPVIAVPLDVVVPPAVYDDGRVDTIKPVPKLNVSFDEFDVPETVTVPPVFDTDVFSIVTNSGLPV